MLCVDKVKIIVMLKQEVCTILVNRDLKKTFGPTGSPLSTERLKEDSRICLTWNDSVDLWGEELL